MECERRTNNDEVENEYDTNLEESAVFREHITAPNAKYQKSSIIINIITENEIAETMSGWAIRYSPFADQDKWCSIENVNASWLKTFRRGLIDTSKEFCCSPTVS